MVERLYGDDPEQPTLVVAGPGSEATGFHAALAAQRVGLPVLGLVFVGGVPPVVGRGGVGESEIDSPADVLAAGFEAAMNLFGLEDEPSLTPAELNDQIVEAVLDMPAFTAGGPDARGLAEAMLRRAIAEMAPAEPAPEGEFTKRPLVGDEIVLVEATGVVPPPAPILRSGAAETWSETAYVEERIAEGTMLDPVEMGALACPVMIIAGDATSEDDRTRFEAQVCEFADFRGICVVPGAGLLVTLDQPGPVAAILDRYLQTL
ncbi:MAG: hypothetical protein ACYC1D_02115 [Acidimicrobiales bacterium]